MNSILKTERLLLRPLRVTDAADVFEWVGDPAVNRWMPYALYTDVAQVRAWLTTMTDSVGDFAICLHATGKVIGSGGVTFDPERGAYELGYNFNRAYWGQGYATEASRAMLQWAYETLGAHDFVANHANGNPASGNVLRKCGFRFDHFGKYGRFDGSAVFDASFYTLHLD